MVVGGGAAGVELALALQARLRADLARQNAAARAVRTTLVASSGLLPTLAPRARRLAAAALARAGIDVLAGRRVVAVGADHVDLDDGVRMPADFAVISTTARAPAWLATLGLPVSQDGALVVGPTLQCEGEPRVFAAGDCAYMAHAPREKAGVFAVRQGPILAANLAADLRGERLQPFVPQERFLVLLSTADGRAIAARGSLAYEGRAAWWLKDRIDRRFMARFRA
jgi:selenide,water dikinase